MPDRTGHPRLMSAVRKLGMRTGKSNHTKTLLLECQVSNQGLVVVDVDMIGLVFTGF